MIRTYSQSDSQQVDRSECFHRSYGMRRHSVWKRSSGLCLLVLFRHFTGRRSTETVKWHLFTCFIPSFHRKKKHFRMGDLVLCLLLPPVIKNTNPCVFDLMFLCLFDVSRLLRGNFFFFHENMWREDCFYYCSERNNIVVLIWNSQGAVCYAHRSERLWFADCRHIFYFSKKKRHVKRKKQLAQIIKTRSTAYI